MYNSAQKVFEKKRDSEKSDTAILAKASTRIGNYMAECHTTMNNHTQTEEGKREDELAASSKRRVRRHS